MSVQNIAIVPVKAYWGEDRPQIESVVINKTGLVLQNKYFILEDALGVGYYVWFNVDGLGVDPAVAGRTGIEVAILSTDTVVQIATKVSTAINADAPTSFTATSASSKVTVTHVNDGYANKAHDAFELLNQTGFKFAVEQLGSEVLELGCLDGDVSVKFETNLKDILCHASGEQPVAKLLTSQVTSVSLSMQELHFENIKKIITSFGTSYLPSGAAPTEVLGSGTGNYFQNIFNLSQRLVLHPVANADNDYSGDFAFWKAYGNLSELVFSGTETLKAPIEFSTFPDDSKPAEVNVWAYGDWTQL